MSGQKTLPTGASVDEFIAGVMPKVRRDDAYIIRDMMARVTGCDAVMWGPSIIGYGQYDYTYESGHSGTFFRVGFSPRKASHSFYFMPGYGAFSDLIKKLGPVKTGASCVYVTQLAKIDQSILEEITRRSFERMNELYPEA